MAINRQNLSLPDFCSNYTLLLSLISAQIILTCLWLLVEPSLTVDSYGLWSLYIQTWVVLNCALLCVSRSWIGALPRLVAGITVIVIAVLLLVLVQYLATWFLVYETHSLGSPSLVRQMIVAALVALLALRIFALIDVVDSQSKTEAQSRIHALQSKIQPHFLFNSLNTISELAATDAQKAESAIQALAMLFRVSLEDSDTMHSLAKELRLCERFLELEFWRLSTPPQVLKSIKVKQPEHVQIPKLLLQPLFENALKYGVSAGLGAQDAVIELSVQETEKIVSLKLRNNYKDAIDVKQKGHGIALNNIRERLLVLYQDNQSFKTRSDGQWFEVLIKIPKQISVN